MNGFSLGWREARYPEPGYKRSNVLDVGNPLTTGLVKALAFRERSGSSTREDVSGAMVASTLTWRNDSPDSYTGLDMRVGSGIPTPVAGMAQRTVVAVYRLISTAGYGGYGMPVGWNDGNPFLTRHQAGGPFDYPFFGETGGNVVYNGSVAITPTAGVHALATSYSGSDVASIYDGTQVLAATRSSGPLVSRSEIGVASPGDGHMDGVMLLVGVWNRVLTPAEVATLKNDPYSIYLP